MGRKLKRLKGGAKAEKWRKGSSCVSNPTSTKYRDLEKQSFLQKLTNDNLTEDAVKKHAVNAKAGASYAASVHTAMMGTSASVCSAINGCPSIPASLKASTINISYKIPEVPMGVARTTMDLQRDIAEKSMNAVDDLNSQAISFTTRYTTCCLPGLERCFSNMSVTNPHHVSMLALHATVRQKLKDKNLSESPSSFFVAIMMFVEGLLDDPIEVAAGLALVVRIIKTVPLRVLRARCSTFGTILDTIINKYQDDSNVQLLSHDLGCLSILIRAQHLASWYQDDQLRTWLKNILVFTMHSHPKVRKSAQYNVSAVLKGSSFMVTSPLRTGKEDDEAIDSDSDDIDDQTKANTAANTGSDKTIVATAAAASNGVGSSHDTEAIGSSHDTEAIGSSHDTEDVDEAAGNALEIHPAADLIGDFLISQLKSSGSTANKTTLHMLVFTRQVIMAMPQNKLQVIIRCLLSMVSLDNGLVNSTVMRALQVLCEARPPVAVLPLTLTHQLIASFTIHKQGNSSAIIAAPHDYQAVQCWSGVVTAAIQHAIRLDTAAGLVAAGDWCYMTLQYWRTDDKRVLTTIEGSLRSVLGSCYDAVDMNNSTEHEVAIRTIVQHLEGGVSYQYQGAWPCVFRLLGQCYNELGLYYAPLMMPSLKALCELMANTTALVSAGELEKAIGKAVQGLGVEAVVSSAPLTITGDICADEKNLWLLPLLRKYVKGSRLIFFKDHFMPLAAKCFEVINKLQTDKNADSRLAQTYSTIQYQLWAILPSFADGAMDVEEAQMNKIFARLICRLIENSDESRIDAMRALRNMISADQSMTGKLSKNSCNYLPALFNIFVKEPKTSKNMDKPNVVDGSHRKAAFETIRVYLAIVPLDQCNVFMSSILTKYKAEEDFNKRSAMLHLARVFVPYVSAELINKLVETVEPLIKTAKDRRAQKAAYKVLQEVLSSESESTEQYINANLQKLSALLIQTVSKAAHSSRAPRLRCAKVVLSKISINSDVESREEFLKGAIAESVLCIGRTHSTAARLASNDLLQGLSEAMGRIHNNDVDIAVRECMRLLSGGLFGRPALLANTVYAITVFTYHNKEKMPVDIIQQNVTNMCLLLACASREVVQACLSFVKGIVSLYPTLLLRSLVKLIVDGIVSMKSDCTRKYRTKTDSIITRLMDKFGAQHICEMVPQRQEILHKRLRNLRKKASRSRRDKEAEDAAEEEQDDGPEDIYTEKAAPTSLEEILAAIDPDTADANEDAAAKTPKRQRKQPAAAWVEEDDSDDEVLDLLGPAAAQAIRSVKPRAPRTPKEKEQEEEDGYSVDPVTGKLVIVEDVKGDKADNKSKQVTMEDMEDMMHLRAGAQTGKISKRKRGTIQDDDDDSADDAPIAKRSKQKNKFDYGSEFRSKKGRGDSIKKGQSQTPYAYVPLSKDRLNRRKQAKYEGQFKAVVKGAKRGMSQGSKMRKSGKKNM